MLWSTVAFMFTEGVTGIHLIHLFHQSIARDLRKDTRGSNRIASAIAFDERRMRNAQTPNGAAIHQGVLWSRIQLIQRELHRPMRRLQNVDLVYRH